jgi:hypothetical protein
MINYKYIITALLLLLGHQNSIAQGLHWVQMNIPPGTDPQRITTYGTRVFLLTQTELLFTDDDGISWKAETELHSQYRPFKLFQCDTTLFLQHASGYFLDRSTNGGTSWDSVIGYGDYLYASSTGLFYTTNSYDLNFVSTDGDTKFPINRDALGVITRFIAASDNYIMYLTDSVSGYGRRYTITADLGKTWYNFRYPSDGEKIYIVGDLFFTSGHKGIYRSIDTCQTWMLIDSTVKVASSNRDLYFLGDKNTIFVFSDSLGILYSLDQGFTWKPMNDGIPNFKFAYFASGVNGLYVSLQTGELYHSSLPATTSTVNTTNDNCSVFPNPLGAEGNIEYLLPSHSIISLSIYDALGRIVDTPIPEQPQEAGDHTLSFDTKSLSPGIYHCRLRRGSEVSVKKFLKQ